MIGGMASRLSSSTKLGLPLLARDSSLARGASPRSSGVALHKFAVEPARGASVVDTHHHHDRGLDLHQGGGRGRDRASAISIRLPAFSGRGAHRHRRGDAAAAEPVGDGLAGGRRWWRSSNGSSIRTRLGKAMLASVAQPAGRPARRHRGASHILLASFALSAALGALAGILTAPITLTRYDIGVMLGLKGFCAAILGGTGKSAMAPSRAGSRWVIAEAMTGRLCQLRLTRTPLPSPSSSPCCSCRPQAACSGSGGHGARLTWRGSASARNSRAAGAGADHRFCCRWCFPTASISTSRPRPWLNAIVCVGLNLLVGYGGPDQPRVMPVSSRWAPMPRRSSRCRYERATASSRWPC